MEYLIFGMGGVGASVFERLSKGGRSVAGIAHGAHLDALRANWLQVNRAGGEPLRISPVQVSTAEEYDGKPDVVYICVKGYSLESVYPLLERVCDQNTIIIPLLNLYGTGERMALRFAEDMGPKAPICTCGCIYVSAELSSPGVLLEHGQICRIFFGMSEGIQPSKLVEIAADSTVNRLECILSQDIPRDTLAKFSYVSPMGATAIIHASNAGDAQHDPAVRGSFISGIEEIVQIGEAMGIVFDKDMVKTNLDILDALNPIATTSMQRDLESGRPSEYDGLIEEVIRLGQRYGISTPTFLEARKMAHERFEIL